MSRELGVLFWFPILTEARTPRFLLLNRYSSVCSTGVARISPTNCLRPRQALSFFAGKSASD